MYQGRREPERWSERSHDRINPTQQWARALFGAAHTEDREARSVATRGGSAESNWAGTASVQLGHEILMRDRRTAARNMRRPCRRLHDGWR